MSRAEGAYGHNPPHASYPGDETASTPQKASRLGHRVKAFGAHLLEGAARSGLTPGVETDAYLADAATAAALQEAQAQAAIGRMNQTVRAMGEGLAAKAMFDRLGPPVEEPLL